MRVTAKIALRVESGNLGRQRREHRQADPKCRCALAAGSDSGGLEGKRTAFILFDMPGLSDMIPFAEPFFPGMHTDVLIIPIMDADDMHKGLGKLG